MPIISDISLTLDMKQVLRREGIREHTNLRPELIVLLQELLASIKNLHLLKPAIAYRLHPIIRVHHDRLCLEDDTVLHGRILPALLASARELAVVCTIGSCLEAKVADYFAQNDPLRATLLDGIGSAGLDSLSQEVCQFMKREASSRGCEASSPLSPGMPGWPTSEQWQLFHLVPAEQIGVCLTSSAMMVPRKSISMVIGIGPDMPTWTHTELCNLCGLKKTCTHRIHA